jgi:isoleucyl-tRNA synthetase
MIQLTKDVNFAELCITSSAKIEISSSGEILAQTVKAEGEKCPVCWKISKTKCDRHSF